MFDFLRNKFEKGLTYSKNQEKQIREDLFNIFIEGEVHYDLAEKMSYKAIEYMNSGMEYKKAIQITIKEQLNSTYKNLKKGIILLIGFQGHGKTTSAHKLAKFLKSNFKVGVTTLDQHRTAAINQLEENLKRFDIPFIYPQGDSYGEKCQYILEHKIHYDYIIVDTAGINYMEDSAKSQELHTMVDILKPQETIMVINTLLGHSLFKLLETFKQNINITGAIMTNVDGDKKGGSFLSFYYMMKVPIFFLSNGEQVQNFEKFQEDSITNILVGELDLAGLENIMKHNVSQSIEDIFMNEIVAKGVFTLEHFLLFTNQTQNIGLGRVAMGLGLSGDKFKDNKQNEGNILIIKSVIGSMTKKERQNKVRLNPSRIQRISKGCGRTEEVVQQVYASYEKTREHMLKISHMLKNGNQDLGQMVNMLKNLIKSQH